MASKKFKLNSDALAFAQTELERLQMTYDAKPKQVEAAYWRVELLAGRWAPKGIE